MRYLILSALAVFAITLTVSAEDKIDAKKLVGKWSPKEKQEGVSVVLEFTKDGKASFTIARDGKEEKSDGTYTVEGNKVTISTSLEGREKMERTITKLTDAELVTKDDKGKERTFLKVKDKK